MMDTCFYVKLVKLDRIDGTEVDSAVVVPVKFLSETGNNSETKLVFGLKEMNIKLFPGRKTDSIKLSQDIFEEFNLYENMEICAKFEKGNLKLGPLMGIFINEHSVGRLSKGAPTVKMIEMVKAAMKSKVIVYFFSVDDIVWSDNSVNAVFYKPESNSWEGKTLPLPDVLYDRGGGFTPESLVKARNLRSQLKNIPDLQRINTQHYFDKWDMHCQLSKHEEISIHLPETILFNNNVNELEQMTNKYAEVYLKMRTGSNGKQVIRVRKQAPSLYEYSYYKEKMVRGNTQSLNELISIANELMNYKSFIIQQGIDVLTYQNNKVDVRVLVQRDEEGVWQITSMPVRIAVDDCAVTSTKSGSRVYQFDDAFNNILKFNHKQIDSTKWNIIKLIFTAVSALEKEYGTLGEMGIDVAIDKNQNPWFIESNAKPAKDTILIAGPREDIEKSFRLPFGYCRYLTGFGNICNENNVAEDEEIEEE